MNLKWKNSSDLRPNSNHLGERFPNYPRKPNDGVNKFKLGHLNTMLRKANQILSDSLPLEDFTEFDVDLLPSNSNVVFVLAQYTDAIYSFRRSNTHKSGGVNLWTLKDSRAKVRTGLIVNYKYRD
jgi:hypothetical protein